MPVTALPDIAGAINARLRSLTDVAALAGTRISTTRQSAWDLGNVYAILIQPGRGGGENGDGTQWERADLWFYGPGKDQGTRAKAGNDLWRTAHFSLCPPIGSGRAAGFRITASGATVSVLKVELEGGPLRLVDPDDDLPYTLASYRIHYAIPEAG